MAKFEGFSPETLPKKDNFGEIKNTATSPLAIALMCLIASQVSACAHSSSSVSVSVTGTKGTSVSENNNNGKKSRVTIQNGRVIECETENENGHTGTYLNGKEIICD